MEKKQKTIQAYRNKAEKWARGFDRRSARIKDIDRVFHLMKRKENPSVLELGCGTGRDAVEIRKWTLNYIGIDAAPELLEIAREKNPAGVFEVADFETYAFPENLDIIFAFHSLIHSPKEAVQEVLQKADTALNSRGIFFLSLFHGDYKEVEDIDEHGTRYFYYYTPELIAEMAGDGFELIYQEVYPFEGKEFNRVVLRKK